MWWHVSTSCPVPCVPGLIAGGEGSLGSLPVSASDTTWLHGRYGLHIAGNLM